MKIAGRTSPLFFAYLFCWLAGELCSPPTLHAETSAEVLQFVSHVWDNDDGLPQNSVQAIQQTRDGYLWIGTQMGLARFDGVHFAVFDTNNVPELKGRSISTFMESCDGSLWIGTYDGGITRLKDGKFTHHRPGPGPTNDYIKLIYEASDGALWFSTLGGLFTFED